MTDIPPLERYWRIKQLRTLTQSCAARAYSLSKEFQNRNCDQDLCHRLFAETQITLLTRKTLIRLEGVGYEESPAFFPHSLPDRPSR